MKPLKHSQKIAIMRILLDIVYADEIIDYRETELFNSLIKELELSEQDVNDINCKSAILALMAIKEFDATQKTYFAKLMEKMIKIDDDIDAREVAIYEIVYDYCNIPIEFSIN